MAAVTHDRIATAPLSDSQRSVWIAQKLEPDSPGYHECALWRIDGPLDVDALHAAIVAIAMRQPMLRTRFVQRADEGPRQEVDPEPRLDFRRIALDAAPGNEDAALERAALELARQPFDLAAAAPIRWALFSLGPGRHALLRVWHHIMSDGLSGAIVGRELSAAYGACVAGRAPDLPPLEHDYLAFTRRQQDPARQDAREADVAYWKERLADAPTLSLPTDFHRPPSRTLRGAVVATPIPRASVDALKALGSRANATPYALFLTAYAALLARLSGEDEVVVGMAVAGRPGRDFDDVVGFFAAMVACRLDLRGAPDTIAAAGQAFVRVHEAVEHHAAPLDRVADELKLPRDSGRQPLFQAAFGMRRLDGHGLVLPGLEVRRVDLELGHARFDLTLSLADRGDGMTAHWHYAADLFERATIERMARQYATLIAAMGREPSRPIATLPLMDEAERDAVIAASLGATPPRGDADTVHARVAAQARRAPGARAIASLDYATLDADASRLAVELASRGVGRGSFVAVARERAADVAIAWLAVLKAGGAYLPVDGEAPDERLRMMLEDAGVALAIADDGAAPKLERAGVTVLRPDAEAARLAAHPPIPPETTTGPDDPAYAIYTSGSTGRPKGVVVPHRAVLGLVVGADYAPLGPGDVVAQLAPPAFDASTFEVWGPLCNGASIAPIAKATALSPRALAAALAGEGVTVLFLTTALFEAVARELPGAFARCRTVMFGGEACDPRRVADVLRAGPPQRLVHVYGPTETTTFATFHEVRRVDPCATTVPIGRAIAHAEAFVLRPDGEACAPGEPGEIVLGGSGVALGYLGEGGPAHRFVRAPVPPLPARRLYRSGDRGRRRGDGAIEFLGRVDGQVKVLGHRIELAEIDAALARHPGVREAASALVGDSSDTRRIVAYLVPANPSAPPPADVRRALRRVLPAWMLPAETVWVPKLPLNASGKIDRRALAEVAATVPQLAKLYMDPRDTLEADLAGRWSRLLGRGPVGIFDRFFDIGGTSLLAARMVDDYERDTGIRVPLSALFANDTVDALARAIREGSLAENAEVVPLHDRGTHTPFVFVHGDFFGGGFHSHTLARLLGPDQPIYAVHPHGIAGGAVPESIEAMASDRLRALRERRPHGPYVVGGHCNGAYIAFELARQLLEAGEAVPAVIVIDAAAPRQLSDAPLDAEQMAALFARQGVEAPTTRTADLGARLYRAMRTYRAPRLDTRVVLVRSTDGVVRIREDQWAALGAGFEEHVLPGDHRSHVMADGGRLFSAVVRGVIDRSEAGDP